MIRLARHLAAFIAAAITITGLGVGPISYSMAFAQTAPDNATLFLSLDEALNMALTNHEDVSIALEQIKASQAAHTEAIGIMLPKLSGNAGFKRNLTKPTQTNEIYTPLAPLFLNEGLPAPEPFKQELVSDNEWTFNIHLEQPIFTSGRFYKSLKIAGTGREVAQWRRAQAENDLQLRIIQAYYKAVQLRDALKVHEHALMLTQARRDDIAMKHERGLVSDFDFKTVQTELARQEARTLSAKRRYRSALHGLLSELGIPREQSVILTDELPLDNIAIEPEEAVSQSITQNETLRILQAESRMHALESDLYLVNALPTLSAYGDSTWMTQINDHLWPENDDEEFDHYFTVGIMLNIPIFDGLQNLSRSKQAKAQKRATDLAINREQRKVILEINTLLDELKSIDAEIAGQREAVALAEESFALAKVRFNAGMATHLDISYSQLNLVNAKNDLLGLIYQYAETRARLMRRLGEQTTVSSTVGLNGDINGIY